MKVRGSWFVVLGFLLLVTMTWTTGPVLAAGSVLDTISQTEEEGHAGNDLSIEQKEPLAPEPVTQVASPEPEIQAPAGTGELLARENSVTFSESKIEQTIQDIIRAILSKLGINPCGVRIIIIRSGSCPGSKPKPQPAPQPQPQPKPQPQPQPQPGTGTGTGTGTGITGDVSTIEGLKANMKANYGINAPDGDSSWSKRQLEEANKVLATLPEGFRGCTKNIQRDGVFKSPNVLGYVQMGIPTVHMMNSSCYDGTFQGTLVHEMTHCFQANHPDITQAWANRFWPNGRYGGPKSSSVSSYGNTQPVEDFAESVRAYWQNGPRMKASYPDRYEFVKNYVMSGKEF